MKNFAKIILPLFLAVIALNSCKEDPPKADFLYDVDDVDGVTVTFTNLSERATSYEWDFGDGNTSTEENPVHVYDASGTYTVTLTAEGEGGSDTFEEEFTLVKPAAIIDGTFSDWDDYTAIYSDPDAENGTLLEFKMTWDAAFLYLYVKGNASTGPVIQVYFDKDNDGATGWDYWGAYDTPGLEYLLEYVVEDFTGAYGDATKGATLFEATEDDWPWTITKATNAVSASSEWVNGTGTRTVEFTLARSLMPDLATTFRVSLNNSDVDWEVAGSLPWMWQDPPKVLNTVTLN
jgi:PKD repeat protein